MIKIKKDFKILRFKDFKIFANFKTSVSISNEISKWKPACKSITNAFLNRDNHLIIKTTSEEDIVELNKPWSNEAFTNGIQIIQKKTFFFAAINNIDPQEDLDDVKIVDYLQEKYGIIKLTRLLKKSQNNMPLKTVKIVSNNKEKFDMMLKEGIKLGYTRFKVTEWRFENGPIQCMNCQYFGHKSATCTKNKRCLICAQEGHTHKECTNKDSIKCCNCGGSHAASSRNCPTREKKKKDIENKLRKLSTRTDDQVINYNDQNKRHFNNQNTRQTNNQNNRQTTNHIARPNQATLMDIHNMILQLDNKLNNLADSIVKFTIETCHGLSKITRIAKERIKKTVGKHLAPEVTEKAIKFIDEDIYTDVDSTDDEDSDHEVMDDANDTLNAN